MPGIVSRPRACRVGLTWLVKPAETQTWHTSWARPSPVADLHEGNADELPHDMPSLPSLSLAGTQERAYGRRMVRRTAA
jgi:hypothetical protein